MSKTAKQLDAMVLQFCDLIANKFKLDNEELYGLWMDEPKKEKEEEMSREKVLSATKEYLMAYCKSVGLKQSGKKEEIVARIIEFLDKEKGKEKKEKKEKETKKDDIISRIVSEKEVSEVRKNKFGNQEHMSTGLVFNDSKVVIGVQNANGKVDSLTDKDIETCKTLKYQYKVPENLSTQKTFVKEDDDDEELDEDDLEEEEEDLDEVELEDD